MLGFYCILIMILYQPMRAHMSPSLPAARASDPLTAGRSVLMIEAEGLHVLASTLDHSFTAAVETLVGSNGHVVATGMGKSGHIARKMAATFASTGTPSFFVHPAEAAHGDLGMITRRDAVLALSDSGESSELDGIIAYTRRRTIKLIAITRDPNSTLGKAADIVLRLPQAQPACPLRLAPTTSTTMMLALGDALAIALLEQRGFSADDFHAFHPAGQLGRRLMQVRELMHTGELLPIVALETPLPQAILEMTTKRLGCTAVVDSNGILAGIVTDGDLRRNLERGLDRLRVNDVMNSQPKVITAEALALKALGMMNDHAITSLFVVNADRQPVGVVHIHDCLRAGLT
jgi:arabinose-5-phosphate isomerase